MAKKQKINKGYKSLATVTKISGESSATVKLGDNYYKFSYSEDRIVPPFADLESERKVLFEALNEVVDNEIETVLESIGKSNK